MVYEVTGSDGTTPSAEASYTLGNGEYITMQSSIEDVSLPSDAYGPVKTWVIPPVSKTIRYDDGAGKLGNASPVLALVRNTNPSLATSSTTITITTTSTTQIAKRWDMSGDWDVGDSCYQCAGSII
jgi:hypothetical protein